MNECGWLLWQIIFDILVIFIVNYVNSEKTKKMLKDVMTVMRSMHQQTKIELTNELKISDKYNLNNLHAKEIDKVVKKYNLDKYE